jgi:DNA polymerase elongation subunit (family B)
MEIISIEDAGYEEIVYDLETEVGTFVAGSLAKGILVKNTDSCYVKFPIHRSDYDSDFDFMQAEFEMAEKCAKFCTSKFKPPMELAFEKYMFPLVLFAKKRYAYTEWTNPKTPDSHVHYKGLQLIRRDTCKYVKEELDQIFQIIMKERSKEAAYKASLEFTKQSIQNLLNGNIDPNKLVLSKQLKSKYAVRKNKISKEFHWTNPDIQQPHVRLAQKLKEKDPANHPKPPDRVPYLFIEKKGENVLQCEKVIHPTEFNGDYKLDSMYYFDHQYKKPLDMVFQFMTPKPENIYKSMLLRKINEINGQTELSNFFKPKTEKKVIVTEFEFNPELAEEEAESDAEDNDSAESISEDLFND